LIIKDNLFFIDEFLIILAKYLEQNNSLFVYVRIGNCVKGLANSQRLSQ